MKTESKGEIKHPPESYDGQLSNAPSNVENTQNLQYFSMPLGFLQE